MDKLAASEIVTLLLGLAIMLGLARALGELFTRAGQPAIIGEILAGVLLGPTIMGHIAPDIFGSLFPTTGGIAIAYHAVITLSVVLLLLIAGLEIDLSVLWRQGKAALLISLFGTAVPFGVGFGIAYAIPSFWGIEPGADPLTFALFFGTAMSISALPVIAKIMMDLNLLKTDVGMLVMGAAMFSDLVGWIVFSIVLGMIHSNAAGTGDAGHGGPGTGTTIALTLALVGITLTVGRWVLHRILPWIQARLSWPGGVLSFTLVLTFACSALTEAIGIHAIFGAFLVGIAVGDSSHMRQQTRTILHQFVTYIFAPIFFVSIGLEADFLANLNIPLILGVLVVAFAGKFAGCFLGAYLGGLPRNEGLAIGFGMNARGAMEIILGLLALKFGVIQGEMFVALVILALLSSVISGPMMRRFVARPKEWRLDELLDPALFIPAMKGRTVEEAIAELARPAATATGLPYEVLRNVVLAREEIIGTGIGNETAIPHTSNKNLQKPILVFGQSEHGIRFDGPDGNPSRLVFLLLTPEDDISTQFSIMGQISRLMKSSEIRRTFLESQSIDVIRAYVKTETAMAGNGH